ncbi:hypothetical protein B0H12DRAFT_1230205 [Mycena haematopus]|nr:hypothetical protein B0H12DRAFT_1230205 [Mycena haematopus]
MKRTGGRKLLRPIKAVAATARIATDVPTVRVTFHRDATAKCEERYVAPAALPPPIVSPDQTMPEALDAPDAPNAPNAPSMPFSDATEEGPAPAYDAVPPSKEKASKIRQNVAHMNELRAEEATFLQLILSLHYQSQVLTPCSCGIDSRVRKVTCRDCLQAELLCRQCWINKHRTMPTHWAFVWNRTDRFFEKHDFCRVMTDAVIALGHYGERCPDADPNHSFTLVDRNGIHATAISFCRCPTADGKRGDADFKQLLKAGIFPGSVKEPKTGYTLGLLDYYRQERSQGKGSAYNFVHVLRRMADPIFAGSVPDIYSNFLAITRFYEYLDIIIQSGHAHGVDINFAGQVDRPYPNRPTGFLGAICAACPERGVNMPLLVDSPSYLRHLISAFKTLDGNFKQNLFYKRDDGSDTALTDGRMHFPLQAEYNEIAEKHVVSKEDTEVPCNAHIGSIRHQGSVKYGNVAVSGVVASACDHAVVGSFVDMLKGEAFALGTYAQREHLKQTNSPPHSKESRTPTVYSYDSWCSFVANLVRRAMELFPDDEWLHILLASLEGQIPADHINGHGAVCQAFWQAVYFACRGHFHGETAEVIWAFLNPLGSSARQMTAGARHDLLNFVINAWNRLKIVRQAELVAAERLEALHLFELHMAVVEDLSKQHVAEVADWSRESRVAEKTDGKVSSVYQHKTTKVLTIESVLGSMIAEEREKMRREDGDATLTSVAQWIHDGMAIQRQQVLVIALLKSHKEHPLQDTWDTISKLRDTINANLKRFREGQREIYPRLRLSALDVDEPELTAIQLPSYRIKHGQREVDAMGQDAELREAEIRLRCSEADSGILAVRAACLALSAVKKARELDYRGQNGITRSKRNLAKAELMKAYEITLYNNARTALVHLGHMANDAVVPYRPLSFRDTRRKETHLHRATGDSRLFDGTAWYLQDGTTISSAAVASRLSPEKREKGSGDNDDDDDDARLMAGTQALKRGGFRDSHRSPTKRLKEMVPDNVNVESLSSPSSEAEQSDLEMSPSKQGKQTGAKAQGKKTKAKKKSKNKPDGWIWLENMTRGQKLSDEKLAEYKKESDKVQWFRAEAEMYRWLEQYERKHAEGFRIIERFRRDSEVWNALATREETQHGGVNGAATFARMQAAMFSRLQRNAKVIFKSPARGAHHDWVAATSFDDLVTKIDRWRDVVFKWMDDMCGQFGPTGGKDAAGLSYLEVKVNGLDCPAEFIDDIAAADTATACGATFSPDYIDEDFASSLWSCASSWQDIQTIDITLHHGINIVGTVPVVYVQLGQGDFGDISRYTEPIGLMPDAHLFATLTWTQQQVMTSAFAIGALGASKNVLTSELHTVQPDTRYGSNTTWDVNTFPTPDSTLSIFQTRPDPVRFVQQYTENSALDGLATMGGFWTFVNGAFALFFGANVLYFLFGRRPLSALGIVHIFQRKALIRRWHEDFPALHSEGGRPGSESAGIVAFLRERLVDVDDDYSHGDDLEAQNSSTSEYATLRTAEQNKNDDLENDTPDDNASVHSDDTCSTVHTMWKGGYRLDDI